MRWLVFTSLLWAFSFGLIKGRLAGIDPSLVAFARLAFSALIFLPWLRLRNLSRRRRLSLVGIGAVQYGLMYVLYLSAFRFLQAYEVALFTVTTPLWVVLLARLREGARGVLAPLAALLSLIAGVVMVARAWSDHALLLGFALLQSANFAFALGQIEWRRLALTTMQEQRSQFALLYAGGAGVCAVLALVSSAFTHSAGGVPSPGLSLEGWLAISQIQWLTIVYLGVVASGAGFFLWNLGATQTTSSTLAVMNNAKIPLAVLVSFLIFGEKADPVRLLAALVIFGVAVLVASFDHHGNQNSPQRTPVDSKD